MPIPPPVPGERLKKLFPDVTDAPPDGTFELGLVLGGTVSAGAYTAGALDYLLEALEGWDAEADRPHQVVLKTAAGSSGGAVCAAILGLLSCRKVPHIDDALPPAGANGNPLWDVWVDKFRIERLLEIDDLGQDADAGSGAVVQPVQHVPALIDCRMIDEAGAALATMGQSPGVPLRFFAKPFRLAVTLANLRGVPYKVLDIPKVKDFSGAAFVQHDDFAWFAVPNGVSPTPTTTSLGKREDEFWLDPAAGPAASGFVGYDSLVAYATASGAMPLGLAARALRRPAEHYHYRPHVLPQNAPPGHRVIWPEPNWDGLPDTETTGVHTFTSVDGGTFNNDPVALAHGALAGVIGTNPSDGSTATRAMLMIDPLASQPKPIDNVGKSLVSVLKNIVPTFIAESRYLTADMELFANDNVFSRFQLVPFRPEAGKTADAALAGTSLFAAAGWCSRAFRQHDFLLGRQNMQTYLRRELVLKANNALFNGWTLDQRKDFALDKDGGRIDVEASTPRDSYFLPILPDKTGKPPLAVPTWPKNAYNPDTLTPQLKRRLKAVVDKLVEDNVDGILPWLLEVFVLPGVVDKAADAIVRSFKQELTDAGLL